MVFGRRMPAYHFQSCTAVAYDHRDSGICKRHQHSSLKARPIGECRKDNATFVERRMALGAVVPHPFG